MFFILLEYGLYALSYSSLSAIISVYMANSLMFSASVVGFILLFSSLTKRTARIFAAPFIDMLPNNWIMPTLCSLSIIGYIMLATFHNLWSILIALLLIGFGYGSNSTYVKSLVAEWKTSKDSILLRYAGLNVSLNIAAAIGPLISTYIFVSINHRAPLYISAIILSINLLISLSLKTKHIIATPQKSMLTALKYHVKNVGLNICFLLTALTWSVYGQLYSSLPLYLSKELNAFQWFGSLLALNAIIVIALTYPITHLLDKYAIKSSLILALGFTIYLIGFMLIGIFHNIYFVTAATILWTLAEIIMIPALSVLLIRYTPGELRVGIFGWNAVAVGLGEGGGQMIGVKAIMGPANSSNGAMAFLIIAAMALVGLIISLWSNKLEKSL